MLLPIKFKKYLRRFHGRGSLWSSFESLEELEAMDDIDRGVFIEKSCSFLGVVLLANIFGPDKVWDGRGSVGGCALGREIEEASGTGFSIGEGAKGRNAFG